MTPKAAKIAIAARAAFEEARARHPDERFYVYALFSEDGDDLQPSCNTMEGLSRRAKKGETEDDLRWFAEEFAYHQLGEEHFSSLGASPLRGGIKPALDALRSLDDAGFFGKGKARAEVAVLFLRSDQDNLEVVEAARKLNPPSVWPRIEAAFEVPVATGKPTFLPGAHVYSLDSLALSADGKVLASAGWFGGAELMAWKLGARPRRLPLKKPRGDGFRATALTPDGAMLFAATKTSIGRWSLPSGKPLPTIPLADCDSLAVSPNGQWLVASCDEKLQRWSLATKDPAPTKVHRKLSGPLAFSPDGKRLAGIDMQGVRILDGETLAPLQQYRGTFSAVAISNQLVAAGQYGPGRPLSVFAPSGVKSTLPGHSRDGVTHLAFSPDGKLLASSGEDGHIRVFDLASQTLLLDVRGRQEALSSVVFLPNNHIAACGRDTSNGPPVYVWKVPQSAPQSLTNGRGRSR